jgi:hypothetical protein
MSRRHQTRDSLATTYRVEGAAAVEEFRALCFLLGRRPHQLVAELVNAGLAQRFTDDPELAGDVAQLVAIARNHQREREIRELNDRWQASR